jgi:hypothetical protein
MALKKAKWLKTKQKYGGGGGYSPPPKKSKTGKFYL